MPEIPKIWMGNIQYVISGSQRSHLGTRTSRCQSVACPICTAPHLKVAPSDDGRLGSSVKMVYLCCCLGCAHGADLAEVISHTRSQSRVRHRRSHLNPFVLTQSSPESAMTAFAGVSTSLVVGWSIASRQRATNGGIKDGTTLSQVPTKHWRSCA